MSYIPDCRKDEYYNEKYLNSNDKEFTLGFDFAVDVMKLFFDNLDIYDGEFFDCSTDIDVTRFFQKNEDVKNTFIKCFEHYAEMERNELITSMIDNMDEDEYNEIKNKKDNQLNDDKKDQTVGVAE